MLPVVVIPEALGIAEAKITKSVLGIICADAALSFCLWASINLLEVLLRLFV